MKIYTPYLVQRCHIKDGISHTKRFSENLETDYMGSSEFEFGALPKSLRAINADIKRYHIVQIKDITDSKGRPLILWTKIPFEHIEEYVEHLKNMREGKAHLKESTHFAKDYKHWREYGQTNFWWDLDNDAMFSFEPAIMKIISDSVVESGHFMEEQKAKDAIDVASKNLRVQ